MIKLKKIIKEYDTYNLYKFMQHDIDFISKYLENAIQFENLIFREVQKIASHKYEVRKIRKDRKLKDTSPIINSIFNAYLDFAGFDFIPKRTESIFAYSNMNLNSQYGPILTVVFPSKNCTVLSTPDMRDSYDILSIFGVAAYEKTDLFDDEKIISNIKKLKLYEVIKFITHVSTSSIAELEQNLNSIDFTKLQIELHKLIKNIESQDTIFTNIDNATMNDLKRFTESSILFFKRIHNYAKNMIKLEDRQPFPLELYNDTEIIITGDKYLIVEYDIFLDNFEWSISKKRWVPR